MNSREIKKNEGLPRGKVSKNDLIIIFNYSFYIKV